MTRALRRAAVVAMAAALAWCATPGASAPPTLAEVRAAACPSDARLLDRHGVVLHERRVDRSRRRLAWTPVAAISPALLDAVIASEDRRFLDHGGVDARALAAALWQRLRGGAPRGASTISMQLAALLAPGLARGGAPRTLPGKWAQMRAAWALERAWSKDEILEGYLNLVSFRGELQGVAAAAELMFAKAPHGLSLAEAATLAALLRGPNADRATLARRAAPLAGAADAEVVTAAVARAVDAPARAPRRASLAPHVARQLLPPDRSGCSAATTTLDARVQRAAVDAVHRQMATLQARGVRDAALLVADTTSGDVLAYVASSGAPSSAAHVDGVHAPRQAGSTLKPILYGLALERRLLTAATRLDDAPLEIPVAGGLFRPRNYDDVFRGPVSVRTALAGSLNVPAVRALQLVGADDFADRLRAFGFDSVRRPGGYYGPALALGSAEVTLWQLVAAYRALANGGAWSPLRLAAADGRAGTPRRVLDPAAAFVVADILADRDGRAVTFGLESPLATRFWAAVKTGTSTDMRDNWCIGFSRRYAVGVWVGNAGGAPMHDVSGVTGAAPIWAEIMDWLHRDAASPPPAPPRGVERARDEWYLPGTAPGDAAARPAAAPRILAPADGAIIAIDPDIAAPRQRLALQAAGGAGLRWLVDGTDLGDAGVLVLWPPSPGGHEVALTDASGRRVASARFQVRGSPPSS